MQAQRMHAIRDLHNYDGVVFSDGSCCLKPVSSNELRCVVLSIYHYTIDTSKYHHSNINSTRKESLLQLIA